MVAAEGGGQGTSAGTPTQRPTHKVPGRPRSAAAGASRASAGYATFPTARTTPPPTLGQVLDRWLGFAATSPSEHSASLAARHHRSHPLGSPLHGPPLQDPQAHITILKRPCGHLHLRSLRDMQERFTEIVGAT